MSDTPCTNNTDIEVVKVSSRQKRKHTITKEEWTSPSVFTIETVGTMDSTKVADNLADFAESDEDSKKTWMRYFVEKIWIKLSWYCPNKNDPRAPNLKEGWAFYEHITLARHFHRNHKSDPLERAEPGERRHPTDLYTFFETTGECLNDWGIGVALYFNTMKVMAMALFLAGVLSIPNMLYFRSSDYSGEDRDLQVPSILGQGSATSKFFTVPVSAACNSFSWAECESGYCNEQKLIREEIPYLKSSDGTTILVQENECDELTLRVGMINYAVIILLVVITFLFSIYQAKKQVIFDENQVTASDYSIRVKNPPKDATDPDEWEAFFSKYDSKGIAIVTILLNNAPLLRALLRRRTLRKNLSNLLYDIDINNEEELKKKLVSYQFQPNGWIDRILYCLARPFVKPFDMLLMPSEIMERLKQNESLIKELQEKEYEVTDVLITFETEDGQRLALDTLKSGQIDIRSQRRGNRIEANLFRGQYILDCEEPVEPSAFRYLDVDANVFKCILQQTITFGIIILLIVVASIMVRETRMSRGPAPAAILTSSMNVLIPNVAKLLIMFEQHTSEDDRQKSMYLKITVFRWVNTALLLKLASPLSRQLLDEDTDLIPSLNALLISEMFLPPLITILDISGNLSKHYFAPRAKTMHQMLLCFKGTPYNLAEKYTDVSKIVLVVIFFSALNPPLLFMGAIALFVRHYADKYCLMRIWSSAPYMGSNLSNFSRKYFFTLAIALGALACAYDWGQFPYDRVCNGATTATAVTYENGGDFELFYPNGTVVDFTETFTVSRETTVRVCSASDCCQQIGINFPPVPSRFENDEFEWMSEDQRTISVIYGWTCVGFLIAYAVIAFGGNFVKLVISQFVGIYRPVGDDQKIDFSSMKDIDGYIPQVQTGSYAFPLLACNIDYINQSLIGWNDPGNSYDNYNMIFDVPHPSLTRTTRILGSTRHWGKLKDHEDFTESDNVDRDAKPIFDIVKQWSLSDPRDGGLTRS
eukprot:CAMPEP_0176478664 /NCGR_PEP_ID=MMETSP0200_2-20121128/1309_1 /TAXON_ID=947934 /ORGANISM="Chaetoceros sp., Strain GSL56" /LENGTH=987 /DNA_ID=CAMNT_0017874621 /DNA_START=38 /DNA_END=3001 /DNA_ORIENTATION=-